MAEIINLAERRKPAKPKSKPSHAEFLIFSFMLMVAWMQLGAALLRHYNLNEPQE